MNSRDTTRLRWVLGVGLVGLAIYATRGVWADIYEIGWRNPEQSHILLALPVAGWLAWLRRRRLRLCRAEFSFFGPLAIAVGWAMAWFGYRQSMDIFRHAGALTMVMGAGLTVVGVRVYLKFLPAIAALVFLFPVPGTIRAPVALRLQEISALIAHHGLELIGVPVMRSGNVLTVNGVDVAVADACNGMRMVSALALVSFAFVFSVPMRQRVRAFILVLSPLVALAVNVIRLVPTVLFYGYSSTNVAEAFHDASGWASLLVALGLLWLTMQLLRWLEVPVGPYELQEA